jgi:cytochrome c biogenesis protein CcmG/thiol:disulfide interchange protein DsbE
LHRKVSASMAQARPSVSACARDNPVETSRISYDGARLNHDVATPSKAPRGENAQDFEFYAAISLAQFLAWRSSSVQAMSALRHGAVLFLLACACLAGTPCSASTSLDLEGLRGRVVYLDFWASWCAPCREAFPWMQVMQSAYEPQGLAVIAVNLDHDPADAERFLRKFQPNFKVQFDPQGLLAEKFKVAGMPTSVLIDRHGVLRYTHIGFQAVDRQTRTKEIEQLLAEK